MSEEDVESIASALKPARCPKCGAEIDYLKYFAYELQEADFSVFDTNIEYSDWDSLGEIKGDPEYACPECNETLFTDEKKAEKFLRGEEDVQKTTQV